MATPAVTAEAIFRTLEQVRANAPRVHVITNTVAQAFTANVLLSLGAIPSMTIARDEVQAFAKKADALLINLGTLDDARRSAIPVAINAALKLQKPIVLDPVFVDRSPVRSAFARELLAQPLTAVRANHLELQTLEAEPGLQDSRLTDLPVLAITGSVDEVRSKDGARAFLSNGHPLLGRTTATGCAGGAVLSAFLACTEDPFMAVCAGLSVFNIAGEVAAERARGPGSLVPELLDALYRLDKAELESRLNIAFEHDRQETTT